MTENKKISILYVDDEINNLNSFKAVFRRDYDVHTALSAQEGRAVLEKQPIHILVTDQRMPGVTGVEFLESIIPDFPHPIRILLTGYTDIEAVVDAINKGQIFYYLTKPWDEQQLRAVFKNGYEVFSLREENKELVAKLLTVNDQLEFLLRQKLLS
jgi:response regulator RpfG family c-di-GMP phosphodiesterase